MPEKNYNVVSVPKDLMLHVKTLIDSGEVKGIRNPTEFVVDSIRRRVEQIEKDKIANLEDIRLLINKAFDEYGQKKD